MTRGPPHVLRPCPLPPCVCPVARISVGSSLICIRPPCLGPCADRIIHDTGKIPLMPQIMMKAHRTASNQTEQEEASLTLSGNLRRWRGCSRPLLGACAARAPDASWLIDNDEMIDVFSEEEKISQLPQIMVKMHRAVASHDIADAPACRVLAKTRRAAIKNELSSDAMPEERKNSRMLPIMKYGKVHRKEEDPFPLRCETRFAFSMFRKLYSFNKYSRTCM